MNEIAMVIAAAAAVVTGLTQVRDSYPSLSPDGSRLLFQSTRSGKQAIWIAGGDGSLPRLLLEGGSLGSDPATPSWSPDGARIVFAMRPADATLEEESEIYLSDSDGSNIRRLTSALGDDSHPHWSTDGTRIYFNSARATPDLKADWGKQWIDVYSMAADGSDVRRITDCRTTCTYPVPSPDGRWIAHRKTFDSAGLDWGLNSIARNSEVVITSADGKSSRNLSNSPAYDGWPMWSPDGRWIVFASNRDQQENTGQIHAIRPDGSGLQRLTEGRASRVQPSFTADGKRILVYQLTEGDGFEIGHIAAFPVALSQ